MTLTGGIIATFVFLLALAVPIWAIAWKLPPTIGPSKVGTLIGALTGASASFIIHRMGPIPFSLPNPFYAIASVLSIPGYFLASVASPGPSLSSLNGRILIVAANAIIIGVVGWAIGEMIDTAWNRRRFPFGHCQRCGYDLTGNVTGTCSECGSLA